MRWLRRLLLATAALALLAGARAPGPALELSVLVALYPSTFSDILQPDEIANVWREVDEAAAFVRRSSGDRLRLAVDRVVIDRFVARDEFQEVSREHFWLADRRGEEPIVENDLLAAGRAPGRYDVVAVFYAYENGARGQSPYGAAAIGANRILGKAAYLAVPLAWSPARLDEYFVHELLHCVESIFDAAGHPGAVPFLHNGWAFESAYGGGQHAWYAWVLAQIRWDEYLARPGTWGRSVPAGSEAPAP